MMAALSKRDIEMIFRAETDAAQRPVKELSSDVRRLRGTLEDLAKTSDKTDKTLADLAATTNDLERAQSELANARALLTQLNSQNAALEKAEARAAAAATKYADLKKQMDAAEKPSGRLRQQFEASERALAANNGKLEEARKNYAEVKESIEAIIGPVDNVQDAFRSIAVAQREVTQGLAQAKTAAREFNQEIAKSGASGNDNARIEEKTLEAQRRGEALAEAARKQKQRDDIESVLAGNRALTQQFDELAAAEQRASQVNAFRTLAADAVAAQAGADRIAAGLDKGATAGQRLANSIASVIDPTRAAAASLDGIDERLDAVSAKANGKGISGAEWNRLNNELQSIEATLMRAAAGIDRFAAQQAKVKLAEADYERQRQKVEQLAAAHVEGAEDVSKLTAELAREQAALTSLGTALDKQSADLGELSADLKRVGVDSARLPQEMARIEQTAGRAAPAIKRVRDVVTPGGKGGFLGLDPYQLQNLGYQINDVFTSLGSGAPPMQVLAQQGGQILQIFPGILSTFMAFAPVLVPMAAGFAILAGSMAKANQEIKTLRTANTVLASLGETNGYDAAKFQSIVKDLQDLGVSYEEATASAKIFVTEGLNPQAIDDYIIAAKNLATVNNIDVKTATEELTKAFTAGADEVIELDNKYHFLTDTQRENLIASKDTKDEYNQVNKAFSALYAKMQDGANAAKGPMTDATNTLRGAWRGLLETFADTGVIESVTGFIANAISKLAYLINLARRAGAIFKDYNKGNEIQAISSVIRNYNEAGGAEGILAAAAADTAAQAAIANRATTQAQQAPGADAGRGSRGRQGQREDAAAEARKQAEKDRKKAAREAEAERKRQEREAKALARQYANESDQLTSSLSRFVIEAMKGTQAPLDAQLFNARKAVDEQFKALEDRLAEFREKFGDSPINGVSQDDYKAGIESAKAQIKLARQLGVYESNVNDIMKSRNERLKTIQDDQKAGLITAQEALDRTREVTSEFGPKLDDAITKARAFIASLTPSAETQALLDKFDRILNQSGPDGAKTIDRQQAVTGADANEQKLNEVFQRRAQLVAAANNLYDAGAINYTEKEERIRQAYADTNAEITKGIDAARAYLELNKAMLPPDLYTNAIAQLDLYNSKLKYTDELTTNVKQAATDAIANGLYNLFDTLAKGIADVVTGAGSLGDLFKNLGKSVLNFAATFMKAIADAIVQLTALRIAKSIIGGFHGGGIVGSYAGGQMRLSRDIGPSLNLSAVPRYHEGTQGAGLKQDEMLAVLKRGEKVQTEEQQAAANRQLANARKGGGGVGLRQVLAFGDDQVAAAMQGEAGESVTITHLRRNADLVKQILRD